MYINNVLYSASHDLIIVVTIAFRVNPNDFDWLIMCYSGNDYKTSVYFKILA